MIRVCSHTRTGTHLLCKLLHWNLVTEAKDYEELHYSHTKRPDGPYVHLWRPLYSMAISLWRVREHLGFAKGVSFHDLITVPLEKLPRTGRCTVRFNGAVVDKVCPMKDATGLLPVRWLRYTSMFYDCAAVNVSYGELVESPYRVVRGVAKALDLETKYTFQPVFERVGWWSDADEQPEVSAEDAASLEKYEGIFSTSLHYGL